MLTAEGCALRRRRLWDALPCPCDLLIVGSPEHLIYFADFVPSPFVFRSNEAAGVLVMEPGRAILVADDMIGPFVEASHVDEKVTPSWYNGDCEAPDRRGLLVKSTLETLASLPGKTIGVELSGVPSGIVEGLRAARRGVEIVDITPVIRPLRRAKDADEIAAISRAIRAGEAGQKAALALVRPGMTELDVYAIVLSAAIQEAGRPVILYGDFASGPRCEIEKGGSPTSRVIEPGDLLLLDFSVIIDGYRGDFTNTFAVGGEPSSAQLDLFNACMAAFNAAESKLKAGSPAREVHEAVVAAFTEHTFAHLFPHHTGHGIGLAHPEPPYFVPHSGETLMVGDVVAVEPGLYAERIGGMRFEKNYLITADGFETLSRHELRIKQ